MYLCQRGVYWDLMEIWAPKPRDLGIHIGVDAAGKQGSLEKSMPGTTCAAQNATCSVSAKKLSGLRFQDHAAYRAYGNQFLGDEFGGVENVKTECIGLLFGEDLHAKFVFRIGRRPRCVPTGRAGCSPGPRPRS